MTCFSVRSNIHPTSAPTGTDDDMEGNNKADALCWGLMRWQKPEVWAVSTMFKPENSGPAVIYGISRTGMHLQVAGNTHGVAERRYCGNGARLSPVRLPPGAGLQSD